MGRAEIDQQLPGLAVAGYIVTSPNDDRYNCVAWVLRDQHRWYEPAVRGAWWPRLVAEADLEDGDLNEFLALFRAHGFCTCGNGTLESGFEKIAIYAEDEDFQHVAYQRPDGAWSSKLGKLNDVRHVADRDVIGPGALEYPSIAAYLRRRRRPHLAADGTGLLLP